VVYSAGCHANKAVNLYASTDQNR